MKKKIKISLTYFVVFFCFLIIGKTNTEKREIMFLKKQFRKDNKIELVNQIIKNEKPKDTEFLVNI